MLLLDAVFSVWGMSSLENKVFPYTYSNYFLRLFLRQAKFDEM